MSFYSGYLDGLRGMGKPEPSTLITATTLHTHQPIDQDYVDVSMAAQPEPVDADDLHDLLLHKEAYQSTHVEYSFKQRDCLMRGA